MTLDLLAMAPPFLAAARTGLGVWLALASAHWLAGAEVFGEGGPSPWRHMAGRGMLGTVRRRMTVRGLRRWMAAQMILAVLLPFAQSPALAGACLLVALASHAAFLILAGEHGASGAGKIGLIGLAGTLIGTIALARGDAALLLAGCLVSGGQLLICYGVAGVSKLLRSEWRTGDELQGVMAHGTWGAPWAAALVRPRMVAVSASWALMLGEALFPLALLLPEPWLIAALAAMFAFHLATAVVMRLSLFPWAFVATYPAVLLGRVVREALG
ncbi:MAG: HTTM domain-containing protein [Erythrobacter sp.]